MLLNGGQYHSQVFPGLWLDPVALVNGNLSRVADVIHAGINSDPHQQFVGRLTNM
jgi:hypothetical protein